MRNETAFKTQVESILKRERRYRDPDFSAGRLAEALGVSPSVLSRAMRREFGLSYSDYVHICRVRDAQRLLCDRRYAPYTSTDIGQMVGFANRQSFYTAFKKITGTTPDRYRRG